jgi:hypothetical protein
MVRDGFWRERERERKREIFSGEIRQRFGQEKDGRPERDQEL